MLQQRPRPPLLPPCANMALSAIGWPSVSGCHAGQHAEATVGCREQRPLRSKPHLGLCGVMTISFLAAFLPRLAGCAGGAFCLPAGLLAGDRAAGFFWIACMSPRPTRLAAALCGAHVRCPMVQ
jgi:hypothetical protein